MMTSSNRNIFRATGPLWWGTHRSPVHSPNNGQWRGALMFSLICDWTNGWTNNRDVGDSKPHRAHYYVTVMREDFNHFSVLKKIENVIIILSFLKYCKLGTTKIKVKKLLILYYVKVLYSTSRGKTNLIKIGHQTTSVRGFGSSHNNDVTMSTIASQITSLAIVYSIVYSGIDQRNIKAPRHCYAENVSIWWRYHENPMERDKTSLYWIGDQFLITIQNGPRKYIYKCPLHIMRHFVQAQ